MGLLFLSNSVMISHLGINPVSGGSPPVDNKIMAMIGNNTGALFHSSDIVLIDEKEWVCRIKNTASVNMI